MWPTVWDFSVEVYLDNSFSGAYEYSLTLLLVSEEKREFLGNGSSRPIAGV